MTGLDDLIGTTYGPYPVSVTGERVAEFVSATGGNPDRWGGATPPMFASAALFSAAPAFLQDEAVVPFTRSLIHSEQSFVWTRSLEVGETLEVAGTVQTARARGSLNLVTFSLAATSNNGPWLTGSSVFLMSTEAAATAEDANEPDEDARPPVDLDGGTLTLPAIGETLVNLRCGASRSDLVRYAVASQDWNPIHVDHAAARAAGLGGVVVHGLLMAAWMARLATRYGTLAEIHLRFRKALRPSIPAVVTGSVVAAAGHVADLELVLSAEGQRLVTARASVTP